MTIVLVSDGMLEREACRHLANAFQQHGRPCLTVGPAADAELRLDPQLLPGHPALEQASAIGLFLQDPADIRSFLSNYRTLCHHLGRQPAAVFSGPLVPLVGDALIADLSQRLGCDLLMVSGDQQLKQLEALSFNWPESLARPTAIATGFWFPSNAPNQPVAQPMLLALIQETIPTHIGAREQLLRQLNRWAWDQPHWTVMLQRDHPWSADRPLFPDDQPIAPNLHSATPGQLLPLLSSCTACLTVSSPWILAAMQWGRIPVIVGDYGIHEEQQTTRFFGSGVMHRLRSIRNLDQLLQLPRVNQHWLAETGGCISDGAIRLLQALDRLQAGRTL